MCDVPLTFDTQHTIKRGGVGGVAHRMASGLMGFQREGFWRSKVQVVMLPEGWQLAKKA